MISAIGMKLAARNRAKWWPDGASWAIETVAGGRSWNASLTCSRAGTKFAQNLAGAWQSFGPHVPAITDRGLLVEDASTNLCSTHNAAPSLTGWTRTGDPAATLTIVDDTAALASAGLGVLCPGGQVYRLDNSTGSAAASVASAGGTASVLLHHVSVFGRSTGNYRAGVQNNSPTLGASTAYERRFYAGAPNFSGAQFFLLAQPGTIVHFVLHQLETTSVSSPIVTAGSSATRAQDLIQLEFPAGNWRVSILTDNSESQAAINGTNLSVSRSEHDLSP